MSQNDRWESHLTLETFEVRTSTCQFFLTIFIVGSPLLLYQDKDGSSFPESVLVSILKSV